ncbi:MAG: hypothetical protein COW15_06495 [Shewanella sp. CG12_big_fil_rev_8_21_14_0_65_47_15]|nr:MAG: hypothetical protein COW15_06495 [Shewanella sp. CG12_big_fil_rev_8_21_14_0_65_47_15]
MLPSLPVFDVLLAGGISPLRVIDILVKILIFLALFFVLRSLLVKLESESIEPYKGLQLRFKSTTQTAD